MNGLHHVQAAIVPQGRGEQRLEGLFLFGGGLWHRGIEHRLNQRILRGRNVVGVVQGVIDVGRPVVKGREQESQRGGGDHLVHRAVVEQLFLRDVVEIRLCLLDGADGAEDKSVGLVGIVRLRIAVLALEGNIVAVAAQQDR